MSIDSSIVVLILCSATRHMRPISVECSLEGRDAGVAQQHKCVKGNSRAAGIGVH